MIDAAEVYVSPAAFSFVYDSYEDLGALPPAGVDVFGGETVRLFADEANEFAGTFGFDQRNVGGAHVRAA